MIRLLKIELNKIIYNRTFWIIFIFHFLLLIPTSFGLEWIMKSMTFSANGQQQSLPADFSVFNYPNVWLNITYLASWFEYLLVILVVIIITNEFQFRTLRQNIIDGMSKWEVILAKEQIIVLISLCAVIAIIFFTFLVGHRNASISMFTGSVYLVGYLLQLLVFFNIAFFISSWIKKTGLVIVILVLGRIVEWLLSFFISDSISEILPLTLIGNLVPNPYNFFSGEPVSMTAHFSLTNISMSIIYIGVCIGLNYWLLKKGHAVK